MISTASSGTSAGKRRSGNAPPYAPAASRTSAARSKRCRSLWAMASSTRVAAPMAVRMAPSRSLPSRAREMYTLAFSELGSDSRFSSEERMMVSGVRISCASLPASVRRYPVYSSSRPSSDEKLRDRSPSSSRASASGSTRDRLPSRPSAVSLAVPRREMRSVMRPANQKAATTANSVTNSVRFSSRVSARSRSVSQRSAVWASCMTPKTYLPSAE